MCVYYSGFVGATEGHHPLMVMNRDGFYVLDCIHTAVLLIS